VRGWRGTDTNNHILILLEEDIYLYEAFIENVKPRGYELRIALKILKDRYSKYSENYLRDFTSDAHCKTLKQAKQLEAQIRLAIMEAYL
jgi:hypothetical protein